MRWFAIWGWDPMGWEFYFWARSESAARQVQRSLNALNINRGIGQPMRFYIYPQGST